MASCAALKSTVIHSTAGRLREPSSIARPTASGSACSAMTSGEATGGDSECHWQAASGTRGGVVPVKTIGAYQDEPWTDLT
jgi:hypothetical protein